MNQDYYYHNNSHNHNHKPTTTTTTATGRAAKMDNKLCLEMMMSLSFENIDPNQECFVVVSISAV